MQDGQVLATLQRSIAPNAAMIDSLSKRRSTSEQNCTFAMPRGASGQAPFGGFGRPSMDPEDVMHAD